MLIFITIKYGVNKLLISRIRKVYDSTSFENQFDLDKGNRNADFEIFINKINDFVEKKHDEIEQLNSREGFRKEFLGNVSHELKTPLFTAQGYILTLLEDNAFEDIQLQKKYLERANKSLERLDFIVKDLDLISKLESGMKLNYEIFNIIKLISDIYDMLEIKADRKNITLSYDKVYEYPILVKADKERVEQVLINLITNSINYGKQGGNTIISVKSYSKNQFIISIEDDGIGIKEEHISRLYERFYRADQSRARVHGGSGLGLSIVKHIIEAHNEKLFVESKFGKGSTFSFTLNKVV